MKKGFLLISGLLAGSAVFASGPVDPVETGEPTGIDSLINCRV